MTARRTVWATSEPNNEGDKEPRVPTDPGVAPVRSNAPTEAVAVAVNTDNAVRRGRTCAGAGVEGVHFLDQRVSDPTGPRLRELQCEYRPKLDAAGQPIYLRPALRHSGDAAALLSTILCNQPVELIGVLCLTVKRQVICWHLVARGGIDGAQVDPRVVFRPRWLPTRMPSSWRTTIRLATRRQARTT